MTSNKEDYLKVIYEEGGLEHFVANKVIAESMQIAAPSVSEMLAKLQKEGLVEYKAYHGSRLTEKGYLSCIPIIRSHRLWEVFLMEHLGYSWREAHEDAHLLEHIAPKRMVDRLDAFLHFPKTCPHGAVIPGRESISSENTLLHLSDLQKGDKGILVRIEEDGALLDYLARRKVQVCKAIEVQDKEDYEGPVTFLQDGNVITVSCKAADRIYVAKGGV